jgi:hypothetical protein
MQVIVAVVVALVSGLAATWYQLRRQRARLYAVPLSYTQELSGDQAIVTVPVAKQLSLSVYLAGYSAAVAQLSSVRKAAQVCAELQNLGQPLRAALAEVVGAIDREDDDAQLKAALRSPLQMPLFDKFLMAAANGRALASNEELMRQTKRVKSLEQQWADEGRPPANVPKFPWSDDGSSQFGLPGGPIVLGKDLKVWPVADQELPPFFAALRFLDRPLLRESFERLLDLVTADLQVAAEALPELNALLAEHFRCFCRLYLANYGAAPAMIQAGGTIHMRPANRSPLEVPCHLVTNDQKITGTENGLLLSPGADVKIAFVSNVEQCENPDLQDALRNAAESPCEVRVEFTCVSSAWRGAKTIRSRWTRSNFSAPSSGAL